MTKKREFNILIGEDIKKAYDVRFTPMIYLELYCREPNVRLLILKDRDVILGKALLWNVRWREDWSDSLHDGIFMDSVHVIKKMHEELFKQYAAKNDYIYQVVGKYYAIKGKNVYNPKIKVWLKNKYLAYPRLGNMRYLSRAKASLSNYKTSTTK